MANNNPISIQQKIHSSGSAVIATGTTSVSVSVSIGTTNYHVLTTPEGLGILPFITNKTENGFTINAVSVPTSNLTVNWVVILD